MDLKIFLQTCVFIDAEISQQGRLISLGAVWGDRRYGVAEISDAVGRLKKLETFCAGAGFLGGHNVLAHDIPALRRIAPDLTMWRLPVVDTLFLSPLAFPENPYHRLLKGYKLNRASVNDPTEDARLSRRLLKDEWESLSRQGTADASVLSFYRYCFAGDPELQGLVTTLESMGAQELTDKATVQIWSLHFKEGTCITAHSTIAERYLVSNVCDQEARSALAYCAAWLRVAGGNSVVPLWVQHQFPRAVEFVRQLRSTVCEDPACVYCRETHDAVAALRRYFAFSDFRTGQQAIVEAGMAGRPHLAILPTSGGKSICYQLPALVRHHTRGALTVVISPLQALMKDQVDNLVRLTGTDAVAALYGLLTPPERGEVLERVRLGDIALLYVSPEQLRNLSFVHAINHREIGCWVFDEAHCLSKWGHDFRPDYLYASRFIREFAENQGTVIPSVSCFTATAKPEVRDEIVTHFQEGLGQTLTVFEGTVERENLVFEVQVTPFREKYHRIHDILQSRLSTDGAAIVYTATRKRAEEAAEYLSDRDMEAVAFHAGLSPPRKREIQERFLAGSVSVICATNAFGMGIDKDNVRLVIHADMPGSLENYLQEAGRAGRDRDRAECILLYDEQDAEQQFHLGANSQLTRHDISQILRGLRRARRNPEHEVVITSGELLLDEAVEADIESADRDADTKVKTAVAWLERSGFLARDENQTRVFQGLPRVRSLDEAAAKMTKLRLSESTQRQWLAVLRMLMNLPADQGITADALAELPELKPLAENGSGSSTMGEQVLRLLHRMSEAGFLTQTMVLTAFVRHKVKDHSRLIFDRVCRLESAMLTVMREQAPEGYEDSQDGWLDLSLRGINQRLQDEGHESHVEQVRRLLKSISYDGAGMGGRKGSLTLRHRYQDIYRVKMHRSWDTLIPFAERRREIAGRLLDALLSRVPADAPASAEHLVEFTSDELEKALTSDLFLNSQIKDRLAAIDRGLLFLHEQGVIILQQGLAVFRQAMTITMLPDAHGRRYTKQDYAPLEAHYREQRFQVHVMDEYARLDRERVQLALDYFTLDKDAFIIKYFADRKPLLERASTGRSYRLIVEALHNASQEEIVTAPEDRNMLVLAGPGSGKTRVVVHRCAYLLRVLRVRPQSILILCFNHNAARELRKRLRALVEESGNVTVLTYHALALRLTGKSLSDRGETEDEVDAFFEHLLKDATALLRGSTTVTGIDPDELRDRLLAGYRHILVDEYQDIDEAQYDLISALAGRVDGDPDRKLTIMAVGDDDQNIYTFRGANVRYISRFQQDYHAAPCYLTENYRSTAPIIAAANRLIAHNKDRMKTGKPIEVVRSQHGMVTEETPVYQDALPVRLLPVADAMQQAGALLAGLHRHSGTDIQMNGSATAVLARNHDTLHMIRSVCEWAGIPVSWGIDRVRTLRLHRIREIHTWFSGMTDQRHTHTCASKLLHALPDPGDHPWLGLLSDLLAAWREETGDHEVTVGETVDWMYEALAEQRREQRLGRGVFLGTAHAAKGLEFDHVYLVDGGWRWEDTADKQEAERRLFYVAMTRAKTSLWVIQRRDVENPHAGLLLGDGVVEAAVAARPPVPEEVLGSRYAYLGLQDLYLDYAGRMSPAAQIHTHLRTLTPGDRLIMAPHQNMILLRNEANVVVGRLSHAAAADWRDRLEDIRDVRVLAMVVRHREDSDAPTQCRCDRWELPLAEVVYETGHRDRE